MVVNSHTPAWKRLGLKLKGQSEGTAEDTKSEERHIDSLISSSEPPKVDGSRSSLNLKPQSSTEKRKRKNDTVLNDDGADGSNKKKRKSHRNADENAIKSSSGKENADENVRNTESSRNKDFTPEITSPTKSLSSLRKTVSFSVDTKTDDGDSTKRLYQDWMNSQQGGELAYQFWDDEPVYAKDPAATPATTPKAEPKPVPSPLDRISQKKAKKAERKKSSEGNEAKPERPYIRYLQTYSTDRGNWKFNKTQQTTLLKNALNIHRVPPEMEEALLSYLRGLQGSSIKEKLRKTAKEVLKESEEVLQNGSMNDPKVREAAKDAALAKNLLDQKRRRADQILSTIGSESIESANGTHANGDSTKPKKRNRKRRTDISDDDDFSSSDDSDVTMPSTVGPNDLEDESKRITELSLKRKRPSKSQNASGSDSDSSEVSTSSSDPSSDSDSDSEIETNPKKLKAQPEANNKRPASDSDSDSDLEAQLEMMGGQRKEKWGREPASTTRIAPLAARTSRDAGKLASIANAAKPTKFKIEPNGTNIENGNDSSGSSDSDDSSNGPAGSDGDSHDDASDSGASASDDSSSDESNNQTSRTKQAIDSDDDEEMKILMEDQFGVDHSIKGRYRR